MEYSSQLVVRTRTREGSELIDRVKELADRESKTYSDIALELLQRGMLAYTGQPAAPAPDASEPETAPEPRGAQIEPEKRETPERRERPAELEGLSTDEVVEKCATLFEEDGPKAAADMLADFFAAAEPMEGGTVRDGLQSRLLVDEFESIMEEVRQTDAYREYRQRAIFG